MQPKPQLAPTAHLCYTCPQEGCVWNYGYSTTSWPVVQEENFTKAAKQLHVTQPTLSRQIAQLEEELGGKLFQRSSHNILLTEDGMMLKRRVQEILTLADRTKQDFLRKKANLERNHRHQQLWWYQAPYIVETFLESGGFSGKTAQILSKICPMPPKPSSATSSLWASTSSTPPARIPPTPCAA